jgi:hypothetical protein
MPLELHWMRCKINAEKWAAFPRPRYCLASLYLLLLLMPLSLLLPLLLAAPFDYHAAMSQAKNPRALEPERLTCFSHDSY